MRGTMNGKSFACLKWFICNKKKDFLKISFFFVSRVKLMICGLFLFYKIGRLRRLTALLPPPSKPFWHDTKNDNLTPLNLIAE
jgi:hypothetical protein